MKFKHKKIYNLIVVLMLSFFSLFLVACGTTGGGDDGGDDGGTIDIPVIPGDDDPKIDELFSKFKVITTGDSVQVFDPVTSQQQDFNYLLDRQITLLAEDLIYRLTTVYGAGASEGTNSFNLKYNENDVILNSAATINVKLILDVPTDYDNLTFVYSDGQNVNNSDGYDNVLTPNVLELSSYAFNISNAGYWENLPLSVRFNRMHAINSGLYWNGSAFINTFDDGQNIQPWSWSYNDVNLTTSSSAEEVYDSYSSSYTDLLKQAILNVLINNQTSNYAYFTYTDTNLSKVSHLGFTAGDHTNILNMIYDLVIGQSNVTYDTSLLNSMLLDPLFSDGILDSEANTTIDDSERYYKAYELLVPAMVERALANAFGGLELERRTFDENSGAVLSVASVDDLENYETNGTTDYYTLYPKMTRSGQYDINIEPTPATEEGEYPEVDLSNFAHLQQIILQPQDTEDLEVAIRELWFMAAAGINSPLGIVNNVRVQFKIKVTYMAEGEVYLDDYVTSFTNDGVNGDKSIFDITGVYDTGDLVAGQSVPWFYDLNISDFITKNTLGLYEAESGATSSVYPVMGAYDGADLSENEYTLYSPNNPFRLDGYVAGSNYLRLQFEILNAWEINGSVETPIDDPANTVLLAINFADPL